MKVVHRFPLIPTESKQMEADGVPVSAQTLSVAPSPRTGELSLYALVDTDAQEPIATRTIDIRSTGEPFDVEGRYLGSSNGRHMFERVAAPVGG